MEKLHIFADSCSDIPPAEVEKHGIEIVPISLTCQGRTFREYYDVTPQEYWKMLEGEGEPPTTSMVNPAMFTDTYRRAFERGCTHVLGVVLNSGGSGTYQAAVMAKDMFCEEHGDKMRIEVIDSQTYTYIYGHTVTIAAKMRDQGDSFEAIMSVVKSRLNRAEAFLGVYTLKYLKKSGRVSGAAAFVGEALGLKPISHVYGGEVKVTDKVRGEKAVVPGIIKNVKKRVVQPEKQCAYLLTGDVPADRVDELEEKLIKECRFATVKRTLIGPSVLTNAGPNSIAVAYYGPPRE